jgi:hypothetical protein
MANKLLIFSYDPANEDSDVLGFGLVINNEIIKVSVFHELIGKLTEARVGVAASDDVEKLTLALMI